MVARSLKRSRTGRLRFLMLDRLSLGALRSMTQVRVADSPMFPALSWALTLKVWEPRESP